MIRELILWEIIQNVCKVWPIYQYFHGAYHPQSIGFVKWTNKIIKTHQIKLCKAFSVPGPKALLLVLLNLVLVPPENTNFPLLRLLRIVPCGYMKDYTNWCLLREISYISARSSSLLGGVTQPC